MELLLRDFVATKKVELTRHGTGFFPWTFSHLAVVGWCLLVWHPLDWVMAGKLSV